MVRSKHSVRVGELHSSIRDIRLQDSGTVEEQMDSSIRNTSSLSEVEDTDSNKGVTLVSMAVPVNKSASATTSLTTTATPAQRQLAIRK